MEECHQRKAIKIDECNKYLEYLLERPDLGNQQIILRGMKFPDSYLDYLRQHHLNSYEKYVHEKIEMSQQGELEQKHKQKLDKFQ